MSCLDCAESVYMEKYVDGFMQPDLKNALHIGKMIEAELRRQERTVTWFSRQLHCDRRNVYDIFNRNSIDTGLLLRVSMILRTNFFKAISDVFDSSINVIERQY